MPYYTIRLVGKNVIVKHKQGDLTAMFNGKHSAKILIGKEFGPQSKGICGICDGKPGKYLTADGVDVGAEPNKYSLIGNSYWIPREDETEEQ